MRHADAEVSVIILVLHDSASAARCLESITETTTLDPEFIVVANGTTEKGLEALRPRDDVRLLRLAVNVGFGRGCNLAAQLATGKYLVFLNDDTTVERGWLEALLDVARNGHDVGAVGSKVLYPDGRLQDAGGILWDDGTTSRIGWREQDNNDLTVREVDYCSGCSLLVPRSSWEAVGGFDPRFFPAYYEDVDLSMRLRQLGLRVICQPASRVRHDESASSTTDWRVFISERNRERFIQRWHRALSTHEPRPTGNLPNAVAGGRRTGARVDAGPR